KSISIDAALVVNAAGRIPSIDELDLELGRVAFSKKGISINRYLQSTTNQSVYACGDVSNSEGLPLSPLTSLEAKIVSANLLNPNKPEKVGYPPQASAVFTLPNLAMVGLLEEEAKEQGFDFTVKQNKVPSWFNAKRVNESFYAFKTLVDNKTGLILGAHLLSPEASEVINIFTLAMTEKIPAKNLKNLIFAYPTWGNDIKGMV
ncbi:MAG: NAD(P)/FAD-dependent oxidoreductase, partial [Peptostreptococcaceae bacterium]|nr:NAD(P)/FAD-dependent oxidoreductase [Peptostreptococcaceae bacterium]